MKGIIISIEGTDGAGKHTQQQLLMKDLKEQGYSVLDQSFPHYDSDSSAPVKMYLAGEFGKDSNSLNAYQASVLYAVDRMCTYQKDLKEHYENGGILLFDRYVQSNFIHQCSKIDDIDEKLKFIKWEEELEYDTLGLPRPDLIFFIEMPVEKSIELARARADYKNGQTKDIHEEDTEYLSKSYNNGLTLAKELGWNLIHCVDENNNIRTIEDIHAEIMEIATKFLASQK
ncbi:MAG: deoxynucleoside kinase [Clostridia bacterium]|nr:deoxynucleoside kinase [Clostridia bacterium]